MKKSYALNLALEFNETDFHCIKETIKEKIEDYLNDNHEICEYLNIDEKDNLVDQIVYDAAKYIIASYLDRS